MSRGPDERSPEQIVLDAVSATRMLGALFVCLGLLVVVLFAADLRANIRSGSAPLLAIATAAILFGPGVWYVVAAHLIKKRQLSAVTISMWVAWGQFLGMALASVIGIAAGNELSVMIAPACLAVFFVPALIALCVQLYRVQQTIPLLGINATGFEPLHVQPPTGHGPTTDDATRDVK